MQRSHIECPELVPCLLCLGNRQDFTRDLGSPIETEWGLVVRRHAESAVKGEGNYDQKKESIRTSF
jgi:hypothetical protein